MVGTLSLRDECRRRDEVSLVDVGRTKRRDDAEEDGEQEADGDQSPVVRALGHLKR